MTDKYDEDEFKRIIDEEINLNPPRNPIPTEEILSSSNSSFLEPNLPDSLSEDKISDSLAGILLGGGIDNGLIPSLLERRQQIAEEIRNPVITTDQAVGSALTALIPALIGLAVKGKHGFGVGGMIGAKTAADFSQQRRQDAIAAAKLEQQGLSSLEQALRMQAGQENLERRRQANQEAIFERQKIAEENRILAEERAENKRQERKSSERFRDLKTVEKTFDNINQTFVTSKGMSSGLKFNLPKDEKGNIDVNNINPDLYLQGQKEIKAKIGSYGRAFDLFNRIEEVGGWKNLSGRERQDFVNQMINIAKSAGVDNYGAALTLLEYGLAASGLPVTYSVQAFQKDFFGELAKIGDRLIKAKPKRETDDSILRIKANQFARRVQLELAPYNVNIETFDEKGNPTFFGKYLLIDPSTGQFTDTKNSGLFSPDKLQESAIKRGLVKNEQGMWVRAK